MRGAPTAQYEPGGAFRRSFGVVGLPVGGRTEERLEKRGRPGVRESVTKKPGGE